MKGLLNLVFWLMMVLKPSAATDTLTNHSSPYIPSFYFPIANITLLVPEYLHNDTTLFRTRVQAMDITSGIPKVIYRLGRGSPPWLKISTHRQDLTVSIAPKTKIGYNVSHVYVEAIAKGTVPPGHENLRFMGITINVINNTKDVCNWDNPTNTLCFWPSIRLRAFEETPAVDLGPVGPTYFQSICGKEVSYHIENASTSHSGLAVTKDTAGIWRLQTALPLDREVVMSSFKNISFPVPQGNVICRASASSKGSGETNGEGEATWKADVDLIDRDDNPPELHQVHQWVYLGTNELIEGREYAKSELLLHDQDSSQSQRYTWSIAEDPLHLWTIHCGTRNDLQYRWPFLHSITHCCLIPKENRTLQINSEYNLTLIFNDTTMEHIGTNMESQARFSLTLVAGERPLDSMVTSSSATSATVAPFPRAVELPRWTPELSRLAAGVAAIADAMTDFQLEALHAPGALAVTPVHGIVYVDNSSMLAVAPKNFTAVVRWRWTNGSEGEWSIRVQLTGPKNRTLKGGLGASPCANRAANNTLNQCALYVSPQKCVSQCGLGIGIARPIDKKNSGKTGGGGSGKWNGACTWRSSGPSQPHAHANYSTCTPDIATCPDGECDELEHLKPHLCPQDCVPRDPNQLHVSYNANGRGIALAPGVCSCSTHINCICLHLDASDIPDIPPTEFSSTSPHDLPHPPPNAVPLGRSAPCGTTCRLALVAGSAVLLGGTIGLIFWRYRASGKGRCARKLTSPGRSDALDASCVRVPGPTSDSPAAGPIAPRPTVLPNPATIIVPDPLWEFPRQQLVLEQPLGEGEFGQVLRARALNIAGRIGWTTVAVKTLKEGAAAAELADLLSEFSLLRGVSHPNVVRLLGACSAGCAAGEPFLLLMEFAEHGSLRAYLRRSRHAESDGALPCTAPDGPPLPPAPAARAAVVTPRDVLAFAWQICKGMAYLSDMKLIHRDLAARNVLLAEGGFCKISDFGLTRDVYEDDTYLKRSKGRVPVKWMSLESLADHIYTSKSDVWSFGVLLWELVTLGASPYPGVAVHNLFHLLKAGYRMQRPENCSLALYRIMRSCWHENPDERPTFKELTIVFEKMLEDGVDYLDLNPRTVHNMTYFTSLSNSRDMLDESDVHYGNLNILSTDSVNYLIRQPRKHMGISISLPDTPNEEEARLLPTPSDITPEDFADFQKSLATLDKEESHTPRHGNAYLSPVRRMGSSQDSQGSCTTAPQSQRYISLALGESRHPNSQFEEPFPGTSNVTSL